MHLTGTLFATLVLINMGGKVTEKSRFIDPKTGEMLTASELAGRLADYDVIFFGEFHDSPISHQAELELFRALYKRYKKVALGMEMFERDVQPLLDAYLEGTKTETEFLSDSRPWPNYETDYKPLVEFAKKHKLPVIATNVPRYIANGVAKNDTSFLSTLTPEEKTWVAEKIFYDSKEYHDRFVETMRELRHIPEHSRKQIVEQFYRAQCVKDATMAESILRFLKSHPGYKVFHINGGFHSDYHLGIVYQLKKLDPSIKVAVIATVRSPEDVAGDYLIVSPAQQDEGQN